MGVKYLLRIVWLCCIIRSSSGIYAVEGVTVNFRQQAMPENSFYYYNFYLQYIRQDKAKHYYYDVVNSITMRNLNNTF